MSKVKLVTPKQKAPVPARPYDGIRFIKYFVARGAKEIVILDGKGRPIRATTSYKRACLYAANLKGLYTFARTVVRDLNPANDVTYIRMLSERREIMFTVTPEFALIVIQILPSKKMPDTL